MLHKLKDLGITSKLGIWFFQFLTNRTDYVRIPGGISKDSPVLSGVPQGIVLGPLLFLIMISDINKGTTSSKLVSFADDTRVYSNIAEADDCDNLQYDLNSIYNWAVHYNSFSSSLSFNSYNVYANPNIVGVLLQTSIHHYGKQFVLRLHTRWRDGSCSHKNYYLNCSYICVKCHNKSNTIPPPSVGAKNKLIFKMVDRSL